MLQTVQTRHFQGLPKLCEKSSCSAQPSIMFCLIDSISKTDTFDFVTRIGYVKKNITHWVKPAELIFLTPTWAPITDGGPEKRRRESRPSSIGIYRKFCSDFQKCVLTTGSNKIGLSFVGNFKVFCTRFGFESQRYFFKLVRKMSHLHTISLSTWSSDFQF